MGKKVHLSVEVDPAREAHIRQLLLSEGVLVKSKPSARPKAAVKPEIAAKSTQAKAKKKVEAKPSSPKEENEVPLKWSDFNFDKVREILKDVKGSLSDDVIEERRSYV